MRKRHEEAGKLLDQGLRSNIWGARERAQVGWMEEKHEMEMREKSEEGEIRFPYWDRDLDWMKLGG
jgi:hypothetical protein